MALKTKQVTIEDPDSRDNGKRFLITELPAEQAEEWAMRVFLAMSKSDIDLGKDSDLVFMGMAGIAKLSLKALSGISWEMAKPLLDDLLACVEAYPDPKKPEFKVPFSQVSKLVEEVSTRLYLRKEVLDLHTGFFTRAAALKARIQAQVEEAAKETVSSNTQTSADGLPQSSMAD